MTHRVRFTRTGVAIVVVTILMTATIIEGEVVTIVAGKAWTIVEDAAAIAAKIESERETKAQKIVMANRNLDAAFMMSPGMLVIAICQ